MKNGTAHCKCEAEIAAANANRHLFVVDASVKWVQLFRVYKFLWEKMKKEKGRKMLKVIMRD